MQQLRQRRDATRDRSRDNTKGTVQYLVTYAYTNNNCLLCASNIIVSVAIPKIIAMGSSIKYVTLFLANFDSPCHTLSHIPGPPKSTSHISIGPPDFHYAWYKKLGQKPPVQILSIVRGGFCPGVFVKGSFVWKVLSGVVFCPFPLLSEYIC